MSYYELQPISPLKHFVECVWVIDEPSGLAPVGPVHLLPDGRIECVFNLGDQIRIDHASQAQLSMPCSVLIGPMTKPISMQTQGIVSLVGIRFRAGGAFPFFRIPMKEICNRVIPLSQLGDLAAHSITEPLAAQPDGPSRCRWLIQWLTAHLGADHDFVSDANIAAQIIFHTQGTLPVEIVARRLRVSRRHLERQFQERIGQSPKSFAQVVRFSHLFDLVSQGGAIHWGQAAAHCGYYDQAHLIQNFRRFAGITPTGWNKIRHQAEYWCSPPEKPTMNIPQSHLSKTTAA